MDIQIHQELLKLLQEQYMKQEATITFTQWDNDGEDEEETTFHGTLQSVRLDDNEFGEKDLLLRFQSDQDEVEILMELPKEEADLASVEQGSVRIFGTEAELVLQR